MGVTSNKHSEQPRPLLRSLREKTRASFGVVIYIHSMHDSVSARALRDIIDVKCNQSGYR